MIRRGCIALPNYWFLYNAGLRADEHIARNAVGKLTDVSRPIQVLQISHHLFAQWFRFFFKLFLKQAEKIFGQHGDVFSALTELGQL